MSSGTNGLLLWTRDSEPVVIPLCGQSLLFDAGRVRTRTIKLRKTKSLPYIVAHILA